MTRSSSVSSSSATTPAQLGYRWPAEWEPHAATWLAWPHNPKTWPGKFEIIPPLFARFVEAVAQFEPVRLLTGGQEVYEQAHALVGHVPGVQFIPIETNDAWVRDHGPIFLVHEDQPKAIVDWGYNAWGNKYPPYDKDNAVPQQIAQRYGYRRFDPQLVLEGGAIEGNGAGVLLTTESCLLNPNRNPHVTRSEIEQRLRDYLAARQIIWLAGGDFAGDDTDGHIDQLVRFVNANTVVIAACDDVTDENFEMLQMLYQQVQAVRLEDGQPMNIERLPIPAAKYCQEQRLPASYCNFYIVNGGVIVPVFDDPADAVALERLGNLFPGRRIVGLDALDLAWGLGAFHCMSQQEPA